MSTKKYLSNKVSKTSTIREIEHKAISNLFISQETLIENAASFVAYFLLNKLKGESFLILAGPGNNGEDARALARILYSKNTNVKLFNYMYQNEFSSSNHIPKIKQIPEKIDNNTIIIDGLFGIGLNREFSKDLKNIISVINNTPNIKIALDIPSGICGDTGGIVGNICIKADYTMTFISPKIGLFLEPGSKFCGQIITDPISIPESFIHGDFFLNLDPPLDFSRDRYAHKTSNGKINIISGNSNFYGAPYLSSMATLYSGSGYSTLYSCKDVIKSISSLAPEIIYKDFEALEYATLEKSIVIYGPGLGENNLLSLVLSKNPRVLIIDGSGLDHILAIKNEIKSFSGELIITPHPLEASRLIEKPLDYVKNNPIEVSMFISKLLSCTTVLKGKNSIISSVDGNIYINITGSPCLATSGSGDVLSGIIGGLNSFLTPLNSVLSGVYIHGYIGEILERERGTFSVTAKNIMEAIPRAIKELNPS